MIEKSNSKTVLISMTSEVESTVSAYLLKKQGYRCIGIGLQLFESGDEAGPFIDSAVFDLSKIKNICDYLDIPFYAVNATDIFADKVLDPLVGRVLSGHTFEPMVFLNYVIFEVLLEKAKKFQTNLIASAHYAKVLKNQKTGTFELMVANDLEHDQSYMLSRLEQRHLENLILPLSEIRKKEVEKIGELIKIDFLPKVKSKYAHITHDPRMIQLVEARSSNDLRKTGTIYDCQTDSSVCEHHGIHKYYVGQSNLVVDKKSDVQIDPAKEVVSIVPHIGNIFIDYPTKLKFQHALISQFLTAEKLDISLPLVAYAKLSAEGEKLPCLLYFKNNNRVLVEFDLPVTGLLVPGQYCVFYSRGQEKGKIVGSGIVEVAGVFNQFGYGTLPDKNKESDENEDESISDDQKKFRF